MFISYFNRICQKHSRTAFIVIGTLIIIPFVFLWGSPGDFFSQSREGMSGPVGTMYGKTISPDTFMAQMQATEIAMLLQGRESRRNDQAIQETLQRMRALHEARNRGLDKVTDEDVAKVIQGMPFFQREGTFDLEAFAAFKDSFLKPRQMDAPAFDRIVRDNIIMDRLVKKVISAVFVSPEQVRQEFNKENEKFTADAAVFNGYEMLSEVEARYPTESQVTDYFAGHQAEFATKDDKGNAVAAALNDATKKRVRQKLQDEIAAKYYKEKVETFRAALSGGKSPDDLKREKAEELAKQQGKTDEAKDAERKPFETEVNTYLQPYFVPDQKKITAAVFTFERFKAAVKVTDEQMHLYYDKNKAEYSKEEINAQHILLRVAGTAKPEEKEAKRKQLEDIRQKVAGGADFAELAKAHSDDPGSKEKGGDLGWFGKGMMVEAFEKAALALKKNELSPVVETPYGFHLIKLIDQRSGRPYETVKDEIKGKLTDEEAQAQAQKAAGAFVEKAYRAWELQRDVKPPKPAVETFSRIVAQDKLELKESDWFRPKGGVVAPMGYEPDLAKEGGRLSADNPMSDVIKGRSACYVACWVGSKDAYLPDIAKEPGLSVRVYNQFVREEATKLAREKAKAFHAELTQKLGAGTALAAAAGTQKLQEVPEFSRRQPPMRLNVDAQSLFESIGSKPANTLLPLFEVSSGAVVVFLKSRALPADADFEKEKDAMTRQLKQTREYEALESFFKKLEEDSQTVLNENWRRG